MDLLKENEMEIILSIFLTYGVNLDLTQTRFSE